MALQIRRGTDAERQLIIPLQGELIFTTDTKKLYVGDGTTTGGIAVDTLSGGGGGATNLDGLTDVVLTTPSSGQVLKYNGTNWINAVDATGSSIASLDDIPGVNLTTPTNGQVLKYNGTNWVNDTDATGGGGGGAAQLDELTDVVLTTPTNGQVLKYNGTNWVNDTDATGGSSIASLDDIPGVVLTTPTNGQVLKFNGADWVNDVEQAGVVQLNDLNDVIINSATLSTGQVLKYNGAEWVNAVDLTVSVLDDLTDTLITGTTSGDILSWNGTAWINKQLTLDDLSTVEITTPTFGQVLGFDGLKWVNSNINIPANLEDFVDVDLITPVANEVLTYNGFNWTNSPPQGLQNVEGDLFPQLGGNLDLNSFDITGTGDISITGGISITGNFNAGNVTNTSLINFYVGSDGLNLTGLSSGPTVGTAIQFKSSRGTFAAPAALLSTDTIGYMTLFGHNGTEQKITSIIGALVDPNGNLTGGVVPSKILLSVFPNNNPANPKVVTINRNGHLSVGYSITDDASAAVDINGAMRLKPQSSAPTSLWNGLLAVADGVGWNPTGTGKITLVVYLNAWIQLAVSAT